MAERPDDKTLASYGRPRISGRQIDELIGLARGIAADEVVSAAEVQTLKTWLTVNEQISHEPVLRDLAIRIDEILQDGVSDAEECRDLLDLLTGLCGSNSPGELLKSATLPLCKPAPAVVFDDRRFCFTGTFNYGKRQVCEKVVAGLGGRAGELTMKTHFLVVGVYATDSWKHSAYGTKIIRAAAWRDKGTPIAIISEDHWSAALRRCGVVH